MRVKLFEEYLEEGIAKKQTPDMSRAISLQKESERSLEILRAITKKLGINNSNANYIIKNGYDIIMELIRARMLRDGFSSSGKGAHEAEVAYLRKLGVKETDIEFTDQLRFFRNRILYYGKNFDKEYARKVVQFVEKISEKLR
jgi:hypothetical protein